MMRRTILGSLIIAGALIAPTAASAANSTVVSRFGVPAPFKFKVDSTSCGTGPFVASAHHIHGPETPPLGAGSLQLTVAKHSAADLSANLSAANHPLGDLTALSIASYIPTGSTSMANLVDIVTQPDGSNHHYVGAVQLPGAVKEWTPFDVLNSQVDLTWTEYNQGGGQVGSSTASNYSTFAAANSTLLLGSVGITTTNCSTKTLVLDLDKLSLGLNSATTTVNFEAPVATTLVGHLSSRLVGYHKAVTPTAMLTTGGHGFGGESVSLWQRRAGTKKYQKLGSIVTNGAGVATGPVQHPRVNTAYQWRYRGDHTTHSPSTSKARTVAVRSKVTLGLERRSVPKGGSVAGGGAVVPRHAHLKITLWAEKVTGKGKHKTIGSPVKAGSTKLRRDGTYAVSGKLASGHYKVFTTSAGDKTNAAGRSHARTFSVRP